MADAQLSTRLNQGLAALLRGEAPGRAVAWRCSRTPSAEAAAAMDAVGVAWLTVGETCRVEHPHSAFVRKAEQADGRPAVRTALHAPEGKLSELRLATGEPLEPYVKRTNDFKALRSYLKDICQMKLAHAPALGLVGGAPLREMQSRWASADILRAAGDAGDENLASCLRKLERLFHRRCEEAARAGCCALEVCDGLPLGDAGAYLAALEPQLEWLARHTGVPLWAAMDAWDDALAQALHARDIGLHVNAAALTDLKDMGGWEGRLIVELGMEELGDLEELAALVRRCPSLILLIRCAAPPEGEALERLAALALLVNTHSSEKENSSSTVV